MAALTTPISLQNRGLTANAGVVTTLYPHAQQVQDAPTKLISAVFNGADATIVKGAAIATSDVFTIATIPAGAFVINVVAKVTTAEGATCTFTIGDSADDDGYIVVGSGLGNSTSTNVASFNATTTPAFGVGKYYTAADAIQLTLKTGTAAAVVVKVSVLYAQVAPLVA